MQSDPTNEEINEYHDNAMKIVRGALEEATCDVTTGDVNAQASAVELEIAGTYLRTLSVLVDDVLSGKLALTATQLGERAERLHIVILLREIAKEYLVHGYNQSLAISMAAIINEIADRVRDSKK